MKKNEWPRKGLLTILGGVFGAGAGLLLAHGQVVELGLAPAWPLVGSIWIWLACCVAAALCTPIRWPWRDPTWVITRVLVPSIAVSFEIHRAPASDNIAELLDVRSLLNSGFLICFGGAVIGDLARAIMWLTSSPRDDGMDQR